jgi:hypothetical protein
MKNILQPIDFLENSWYAIMYAIYFHFQFLELNVVQLERLIFRLLIVTVFFIN